MAGKPPGRIGKYAVIRKIASGGMAEVYLCRFRGEEGFEKKVAVKIILPRFSSEPHFRDLFVREARIAASLSHPNLVQVFDFGREGRSFYLAMEYIEGWNLAQIVSQVRALAIPIPLPVWRHWVGGFLAGIGHLHSKGIIHRDISPSNILLSRGGSVKITDFGISRAVFQKTDVVNGLEGKYAYLSPEQARGEEASTSSDLFAAAVISAELFLPHRMFEGEPPMETITRLREFDGKNMEFAVFPPDVSMVLRKGLSGDSRDRYRDAEDFSRAICAAVPHAAGVSELLAFWDDLFPGTLCEEEDTVSASPILRNGEGNIVREKRADYRERERWRFKIGALFGLVLLSSGGYGLWKWIAVNSGTTPSLSSAVSPVSRGSNEGKKEASGISPAEGMEQPVSVEETKPHVPSPMTQKRFRVFSLPSRSLVIDTDPPGVSISVEGGVPLGKTPLGIDITPWLGKKIAFSKEGYSGKSVPADLLAQTKSFRMELERQTGSIEVVQAIPWARVFDGEQYIGDTPIRELRLPVGVHRLRFVNEPLAVEKIQEITIRPGSNPKVIVHLLGKWPAD